MSWGERPENHSGLTGGCIGFGKSNGGLVAAGSGHSSTVGVGEGRDCFRVGR